MRWLLIFASLLIADAQEALDHAAIIRSFNADTFARGEKLYNSVCITCHGNLTQPGSLPTSRPFWKEPFKNGSDPYSIYKTLTDGLGQMPAWASLSEQDRYDAAHYIREAFVKPHNQAAYFTVTDDYLKSLPKGTSLGAESAADKTPKYLQMDFGQALFWTYQVAPNNIVYKGQAIRLDDGAGGISKGRAWMLYDHDTMRVATAWTGDKFIDWKGIAFDGSHNSHASIVGNRAFINPPGPGWANPETGSFEDPRPLGRDNKPYGPLPTEWARYRGTYYQSNQVFVHYSVGDAQVLELPGYENNAFTRSLNISKSSRDLVLRIAPDSQQIGVGHSAIRLFTTNAYWHMRVPAAATPIELKITIGAGTIQKGTNLRRLIQGGPPRWNPPISTRAKSGDTNGPFVVEEITAPETAKSWLRFGGFDFFKDGKRAAICTWNGDVWIVSGIDSDQFVWKRICSGLFQPLGLKIVDEKIYVACRDQIARLVDFNGDEETDLIENFNNDHQVTEHFHEFAMGLQTDRDGNFYYAKSARHALPAIVPHHGTLLKVSKDGKKTEILANGFRAANGVCVNDDGTFFVTDQEGHWTPKNRINWVRPGRFYGNLFGYHNQSSEEMEPPMVWITNEMDRSPGELLWVPAKAWGPLGGSLINVSYGPGKIYVAPHEKVGDQMQGGVSPLPIPEFPTGTMRGRFHPNGGLYVCGLYAWAGNRQAGGGFYRIRPTGKPIWAPLELKARKSGMEIRFSDPINTPKAGDFAVKVWSLKRTADYGSKHIDEHPLKVTEARLSPDNQTVFLAIPEITPTMSMEIKCELRGPDGAVVSRVIHNTIHQLQ